MKTKKLASNDCPRCPFLLCFKLTFILTTMTLLNASGRALSQSVTISGANMPLREIFSKIENQTGYQFLYKAELLTGARPVTLHVKDVPVTDALHQCFEGQPIDFYIEDKTVFIMKRLAPPAAAARYDSRASDAQGDHRKGGGCRRSACIRRLHSAERRPHRDGGRQQRQFQNPCSPERRCPDHLTCRLCQPASPDQRKKRVYRKADPESCK